jgi:predicted RNA-binding protein YlqC (UPF0109 family)
MSNIDQQFIEYIVKELVSYPDDVVVDRSIDEKGVLLTLTVNEEDLGRVIGRRGVTAQSLRTLLRALGTKNDARYNLKIVNNDEPADRPAPAPAAAEDAKDKAVEAAKTDAAESSDEPEEPEEAPAEEVDEADEPAEDSTEEADQPDEKPADDEPSLADKTREELAELDDLDI